MALISENPFLTKFICGYGDTVFQGQDKELGVIEIKGYFDNEGVTFERPCIFKENGRESRGTKLYMKDQLYDTREQAEEVFVKLATYLIGQYKDRVRDLVAVCPDKF
jgi:hypothetical protein